MMDIPERFHYYKALIEASLNAVLTAAPAGSEGLQEAERYSLLAGGKRIRPMLVLEWCRLCGGDVETALGAACAIEMIHTYSLIHDDLPCMDNDTMRRGKPTNHMMYGVTAATLAGDALQADAFAALLTSPLAPERRAECALLLARAAGSTGMCAGQYLDTVTAPQEEEEGLAHLQRLKTGAMLAAACTMGCAAAGGSVAARAAAERYGYAIGLAFQIRDDMLDAEADPAALGKSVGKDERDGKHTYLTLLGPEGCRARIDALTAEAQRALAVFDSGEAAFLSGLAASLAKRTV